MIDVQNATINLDNQQRIRLEFLHTTEAFVHVSVHCTNNLQIQREKEEKKRDTITSALSLSEIEASSKLPFPGRDQYVFISRDPWFVNGTRKFKNLLRKKIVPAASLLHHRNLFARSRYRLIYRESREPGVFTKPLGEPCSRIFHRSVSQSGNTWHSTDRSYRVGCSSVEIREAQPARRNRHATYSVALHDAKLTGTFARLGCV